VEEEGGTDGLPGLRRGVARERQVSVEDPEMRHGRKSRSHRFEGYKRHVLRDLDTGLVRAVGVTPANAPEAKVTEGIARDLAAQEVELEELHIDWAYLSSELVRERPEHLDVYCKAWAVRNAGRYPKTAFALDWERELLRCPAGVSMPFKIGGVVRFPARTCAVCPLRERCTKSKKSGRSVSIHPDERLLEELRERQRTPQGRAKLRERVKAEHSLAHIGHWQGDRSRYIGVRKNLFDLRRSAVVHNLHVIARMPEDQEREEAIVAWLLDRLSRRADDRVACGDAVIAAAYRGSYYVGIRPFGRRRAPAPKAKRSRQASTSAATTRSGEVPGSAILVMKYMLQSCTLKRTFYWSLWADPILWIMVSV
jgi:Transposase DDE domain